MTIPRWRLAITAGALIVLSAIGGGFVQAASASPAPAAASANPVTAAAAPAGPGTNHPPLLGERVRGLRDRLRDGDLGRLRRHLVHATITVLDRDGKVVTLQLDHGTVSAIGNGSITIAEAGGSSVTVATTTDTRVRKDRKPATLSDLAVGDEVVVRSGVDGGSATARWILVPAPRPAADEAGGGGA